MSAIEADEEIAAGEVPDDRVYDLVLRATGSVERAREAHNARLWAKLKRGERPEVTPQ